MSSLCFLLYMTYKVFQQPWKCFESQERLVNVKGSGLIMQQSKSIKSTKDREEDNTCLPYLCFITELHETRDEEEAL